MSNSKWAVVVLGVCLVAALVALAYVAGKERAMRVATIVRAQRFEVVDASGKPRGALGLDKAGNPTLTLLEGGYLTLSSGGRGTVMLNCTGLSVIQKKGSALLGPDGVLLSGSGASIMLVGNEKVMMLSGGSATMLGKGKVLWHAP